MKLPETTGIYEDISREDYDLIDRIHWSVLKQFARSPLHVLEALRAKMKDTDALRFGRVQHWAILEPHLFEAQVAVWQGGDRRTKEGKAAWAAFEAANAGKEILDEDEHRRCVLVARTLRNHKVASKYLRDGRAEVTVLWDYVTPSGVVVPCKARLDYVNPLGLADLKSAQKAGRGAFGRAAWDYCYHGQAAMYRDGWVAAGGDRVPYRLIAAEKELPFAVGVYRVGPDELARGRVTYQSFLDRLAECQTTGEWPDYSEAEMDLELPAWTYNLTDGAAQ